VHNARESTSGPTAAATLPLRRALDEATLEAALARLTRALATADDEAIPELVAERRAMREELAAMREGDAGVIRLNEGRRGPTAVGSTTKRRPAG
jgi:hypothetical protein